MQASKRFAQSWNKRDVSNICKAKRFWFHNQGDFQSYSEHGKICLLSGNFLQNQIELAALINFVFYLASTKSLKQPKQTSKLDNLSQNKRSTVI